MRADDPSKIAQRIDESRNLLTLNYSAGDGTAHVSAASLSNRRSTVAGGGLIQGDLLEVVVADFQGNQANLGNLTFHRKCNSEEVVNHDEFLEDRCPSGDVFFAAISGRGDELELPADGTPVGDYVFVEDEYSDMSLEGLRQRTKDLDLNGSTNHVKSVKFKEYKLVVVGKNEDANVVAVKFSPRETASPVTPSEHVKFVTGVKAFVAGLLARTQRTRMPYAISSPSQSHEWCSLRYHLPPPQLRHGSREGRARAHKDRREDGHHRPGDLGSLARRHYGVWVALQRRGQAGTHLQELLHVRIGPE